MITNTLQFIVRVIRRKVFDEGTLYWIKGKLYGIFLFFIICMYSVYLHFSSMNNVLKFVISV